MTLAEYFAANRPPYAFGAGVKGSYGGMPWVGCAHPDNMRNETQGPMVSIRLDFYNETKYTMFLLEFWEFVRA